jgi:hypothetical protein
MFHVSGRVRPMFGTAVAAALVVLAVTAPSPAAAAPHRPADASYLAEDSRGLQLAVLVRDGRVEAYACDGRARRAYFTGRARTERLTLGNDQGARLRLRLAARTVRATLTLPGAEPLALSARTSHRVAIATVAVHADGTVSGSTRDGGALGAHVSAAGLFGALALPGKTPRPLLKPALPELHIDGEPVAVPDDEIAAAAAGEWRFLITGTKLYGASIGFVPSDPSVRSSIRFINIPA